MATALAALTVAPSGAPTSAAPVPVPGVESLTGPASAYRPITPVRILDTRSDDQITRMWANTSISVDPLTGTGVAAAAGVSASDITAVIVNTTIVNAGARGYSTMWPTGATRPTASTNNSQFAGHTQPNLVIAPLGLDNKISVYGSTTAHVVLDVLGVFVASGPTAAGRFMPVGPNRAYDSRLAGFSEFGAGQTRTIDLKSYGVPANASGVVLNVTAIRSRDRGFYQVRAAGEPTPVHSNVNVLGPGYNAGNQVITGVSNGRIDVTASTGGGLIVDVTGYFTGSGGAASNDGLYVPFTPGRLLDTRNVGGATGLNGGEPIGPGQRFDLQVSGRIDIPATGAKAVALNLTAVRTSGRGFAKAWASGTVEPPTSALNFAESGQVVPNHAITSIGSNGRISLKPSITTDLVVDASGYFLGAGATPPSGSAAVTKLVDPGSFVPSALPSTAPTSGPYDFLFDRGAFFSTGARPSPTIRAAWDNCLPIRYALNIDLARNNAQIAVLIDSIEEMELYTGIDFQFAGVTSAGMNIDDEILLPEAFSPELPYQYLPPADGGGEADVVIGFSNETDTPELAGGVIGVGGSLRQGANSAGRARSLRGFAIIDLPDLYFDGPSGATTLSLIKATTTHELGHMMGLGHVDTTPNGRGLAPSFSDSVIRDQLMFPALNPSNESTFDLGDQRGLFELYGNRPCAGGGALNGASESADTIDWSDVEVYKPVDDFG